MSYGIYSLENNRCVNDHSRDLWTLQREKLSPPPIQYEAEVAVLPFPRISIHHSSLIPFISPTVNQDQQQSLSGFLAPVLTSRYSFNHSTHPKLDQNGSIIPHKDFQAAPKSLIYHQTHAFLHITTKGWIYRNMQHFDLPVLPYSHQQSPACCSHF